MQKKYTSMGQKSEQQVLGFLVMKLFFKKPKKCFKKHIRGQNFWKWLFIKSFDNSKLEDLKNCIILSPMVKILEGDDDIKTP